MSEQTAKILIDRKIKEVLNQANSLYPKFQIRYEELIIGYGLHGKTAGNACFQIRKLNFNLILASENISEFLDQTVPHEIAHLFQRKMYPSSKPHGYEWDSVMIKLGHNPKRCHSYNVETIAKSKNKPSYDYTCKCGKHFIISSLIHNKMINGQIRQHRACKGNIYLVKEIA